MHKPVFPSILQMSMQGEETAAIGVSIPLDSVCFISDAPGEVGAHSAPYAALFKSLIFESGLLELAVSDVERLFDRVAQNMPREYIKRLNKHGPRRKLTRRSVSC